MKLLTTTLSVLALSLSAQTVLAQNDAPEDKGMPFSKATVTKVVNDVKIVDAEDLKQVPAVVDKTFEAPDLMATANRSRAELLAPDGTVTRVGSNTIFSFDPEQRVIDLKTGSLLFHSPKGLGGGTIRTSEASASVLGTTIAIAATSNGGFKLVVLEGVAQIIYEDGTVDVLDAGQVAFVTPGENVRSPILTIDLEELVASSLLLNGFDTPLASLAEINDQARRQSRRILGPSNLLIGDAPEGDQFQIIEVPEEFVVIVDEQAREQQFDLPDAPPEGDGSFPTIGPDFNAALAVQSFIDLGLTLAQAEVVISWLDTTPELAYAQGLSLPNLQFLSGVADEPIFETLFGATLVPDEIDALAALNEGSGVTFDELMLLTTYADATVRSLFDLGNAELAILLARAELSEDNLQALLGSGDELILAAAQLQLATQVPTRSVNEPRILEALFNIGDGVINEQLIQAGQLGNVLLTDTIIVGDTLSDSQVFNRQELINNDYNGFVIALLGEVGGRTDITDNILAFLEAEDPDGLGATLPDFLGLNGGLLGTRDFDETGDFFGFTPDDVVAFIGNDVGINTNNLDVATYVVQENGAPSGTIQGNIFAITAFDDLTFNIPTQAEPGVDNPEVSETVNELVIDSGNAASDTVVAFGAGDQLEFRRDSRDTATPVSIVHEGSHLAFGSGADLNVINVRMTSTRGSVSVATLENLLIAEGSEITVGDNENVYLFADKTLTVDRLSFNNNPRDIVMNATTINLSNVDFPLVSNVDLRSLNGPIDGRYPNFGSSAPGRVNFILNVSRGGNLIEDRASFDQFAVDELGGIRIGTVDGG
ncbi:MAG: FecR domain-containing protein [Opitutales bacterium]